MRPVFIGGCSRSGTTLLGSILGANGKAITTPESQFKIELLKYLGSSKRINVKAVENLLRNNWRFKIWKIDDYFKHRENKIFSSYQELIFDIVIFYSNKNYGAKQNQFWIDHTPNNIKHVASLLDHFPECKLIHLVRDGRAVSSSVMGLEWGPNNIISAAEWWIQNLSFGLAAELRYPTNIMRVNFEDLITHPHEVIKKICNFINLPFKPEMLDGGGFIVPDYTKGQHKLVERKIDSSRRYSWKNKLTKRQIEIFEFKTHEMLTYLGYDLEFNGTSRKPTMKEKIVYGEMSLYPINLLKKITRMLRKSKIMVRAD